VHLKRKTRVPVTFEAIEYKAWKHAESHIMQHHFQASTGWCVYGAKGLVLSPAKSFALPEMNLQNIFVTNEGH
jgi:hypothetical protein